MRRITQLPHVIRLSFDDGTARMRMEWVGTDTVCLWMLHNMYDRLFGLVVARNKKRREKKTRNFNHMMKSWWFRCILLPIKCNRVTDPLIEDYLITFFFQFTFDYFTDFPGMCFASTRCATVEPGKTWELTPFCGRSTCVTAKDHPNRYRHSHHRAIIWISISGFLCHLFPSDFLNWSRIADRCQSQTIAANWTRNEQTKPQDFHTVVRNSSANRV